MRTASPRAKTQPALVVPPQASGTAEMKPAPRAPRAPRTAGQRPPTVRRKRTPPSRLGLTLGQRLQAALAPTWQFLASLLRPLRLRCSSRRLRVLETLSLGNKQTVTLVQVDGEDFLIGGTVNSVSLLAKLESRQERQVDMAEVQRLVASFSSKVR